MNQKIEARDNSVIQNVTQISHVHVESAEPISQRERSIMIERVKASWITGILLPSLRSATRLELQFDCTHSVGPVRVHSIRNLDNNQTRDYQRTLDTSFAERGEVIVIVGAPGSGKSTALLQLMDRSWRKPGRKRRLRYPPYSNCRPGIAVKPSKVGLPSNWLLLTKFHLRRQLDGSRPRKFFHY
jgi:predicted NACHT family NTPase